MYLFCHGANNSNNSNSNSISSSPRHFNNQKTKTQRRQQYKKELIRYKKYKNNGSNSNANTNTNVNDNVGPTMFKVDFDIDFDSNNALGTTNTNTNVTKLARPQPRPPSRRKLEILQNQNHLQSQPYQNCSHCHITSTGAIISDFNISKSNKSSINFSPHYNNADDDDTDCEKFQEEKTDFNTNRSTEKENRSSTVDTCELQVPFEIIEAEDILFWGCPPHKKPRFYLPQFPDVFNSKISDVVNHSQHISVPHNQKNHDDDDDDNSDNTGKSEERKRQYQNEENLIRCLVPLKSNRSSIAPTKCKEVFFQDKFKSPIVLSNEAMPLPLPGQSQDQDRDEETNNLAYCSCSKCHLVQNQNQNLDSTSSKSHFNCWDPFFNFNVDSTSASGDENQSQNGEKLSSSNAKDRHQRSQSQRFPYFNDSSDSSYNTYATYNCQFDPVTLDVNFNSRNDSGNAAYEDQYVNNNHNPNHENVDPLRNLRRSGSPSPSKSKPTLNLNLSGSDVNPFAFLFKQEDELDPEGVLPSDLDLDIEDTDLDNNPLDTDTSLCSIKDTPIFIPSNSGFYQRQKNKKSYCHCSCKAARKDSSTCSCKIFDIPQGDDKAIVVIRPHLPFRGRGPYGYNVNVDVDVHNSPYDAVSSSIFEDPTSTSIPIIQEYYSEAEETQPNYESKNQNQHNFENKSDSNASDRERRCKSLSLKYLESNHLLSILEITELSAKSSSSSSSTVVSDAGAGADGASGKCRRRRGSNSNSDLKISVVMGDTLEKKSSETKKSLHFVDDVDFHLDVDVNGNGNKANVDADETKKELSNILTYQNAANLLQIQTSSALNASNSLPTVPVYTMCSMGEDVSTNQDCHHYCHRQKKSISVAITQQEPEVQAEIESGINQEIGNVDVPSSTFDPVPVSHNTSSSSKPALESALQLSSTDQEKSSKVLLQLFKRMMIDSSSKISSVWGISSEVKDPSPSGNGNGNESPSRPQKSRTTPSIKSPASSLLSFSPPESFASEIENDPVQIDFLDNDNNTGNIIEEINVDFNTKVKITSDLESDHHFDSKECILPTNESGLLLLLPSDSMDGENILVNKFYPPPTPMSVSSKRSKINKTMENIIKSSTNSNSKDNGNASKTLTLADRKSSGKMVEAKNIIVETKTIISSISPRKLLPLPEIPESSKKNLNESQQPTIEIHDNNAVIISTEDHISNINTEETTLLNPTKVPKKSSGSGCIDIDIPQKYPENSQKSRSILKKNREGSTVTASASVKSSGHGSRVSFTRFEQEAAPEPKLKGTEKISTLIDEPLSKISAKQSSKVFEQRRSIKSSDSLTFRTGVVTGTVGNAIDKNKPQIQIPKSILKSTTKIYQYNKDPSREIRNSKSHQNSNSNPRSINPKSRKSKTRRKSSVRIRGESMNNISNLVAASSALKTTGRGTSKCEFFEIKKSCFNPNSQSSRSLFPSTTATNETPTTVKDSLHSTSVRSGEGTESFYSQSSPTKFKQHKPLRNPMQLRTATQQKKHQYQNQKLRDCHDFENSKSRSRKNSIQMQKQNNSNNDMVDENENDTTSTFPEKSDPELSRFASGKPRSRFRNRNQKNKELTRTERQVCYEFRAGIIGNVDNNETWSEDFGESHSHKTVTVQRRTPSRSRLRRTPRTPNISGKNAHFHPKYYRNSETFSESLQDQYQIAMSSSSSQFCTNGKTTGMKPLSQRKATRRKSSLWERMRRYFFGCGTNSADDTSSQESVNTRQSSVSLFERIVIWWRRKTHRQVAVHVHHQDSLQLIRIKRQKWLREMHEFCEDCKIVNVNVRAAERTKSHKRHHNYESSVKQKPIKNRSLSRRRYEQSRSRRRNFENENDSSNTENNKSACITPKAKIINSDGCVVIKDNKDYLDLDILNGNKPKEKHRTCAANKTKPVKGILKNASVKHKQKPEKSLKQQELEELVVDYDYEEQEQKAKQMSMSMSKSRKSRKDRPKRISEYKYS